VVTESDERLRMNEKDVSGGRAKRHLVRSHSEPQLRNMAIRSDNSLVIHQRVRNFAAENDFERRYGKEPDQPIYEMHERAVHQLEGGAFFEHTNVQVRFDLATQDLVSAVTVAQNTSNHSQSKLRQHRAKVRDTTDRLERVAAAVRRVQLFINLTTLFASRGGWTCPASKRRQAISDSKSRATPF
jgi:hypothetical protein